MGEDVKVKNRRGRLTMASHQISPYVVVVLSDLCGEVMRSHSKQYGVAFHITTDREFDLTILPIKTFKYTQRQEAIDWFSQLIKFLTSDSPQKDKL